MIVRDKIRNFQPGDVQSIVDVYSAADEAVGADHWLTVEILQTFLEAPNVDPGKDIFVAERDGQVIGYGDCEFRASSGRAFADCAVHPDFWNQGIGTQLLHATEARILERADEELPPDHPMSVQRNAVDSDYGALRLFEEEGYHPIRTYYHMRIELDPQVEALPLPQGLALRPFERARDARAVYEAHQEAFADHWGFERKSYEEWEHYTLNFPGNDLSLWLIAYEGDEIAGICLNRPQGDEDAQMAWVGTLAVRRPWRKRGLGLTLLKNSFALFRQRGYLRAGLGVDAASLTNAVALYERAGMHVHMRILSYRKTLRGTFEDEAMSPPR